MSAPAPLLAIDRLSKAFGGSRALDDVSLAFRTGEIHALVGENGAGKSTLIRCCTGVISADSGRLLLEGNPVVLQNPRHARQLGIRAVHQEAEFFPELSLAENLMHAEGTMAGRWWWIDWQQVRDSAREELGAMELDLPVETPAIRLGLGQRMMAEIAACVARRSRLLFLDEPTASLSARESEHLFAQLLRLKQAGTAIVYVSHRLEEVLRLADQITVLRDGRIAAAGPRGEFDRDRLISAMVGRAPGASRTPAGAIPHEVVLAIKSVTDEQGRFHDVSLDLHAGEIVGLYGLVGAGRSELAEAVVGLRACRGSIMLRGKPFRPAGPAQALAAGVVLVPEDRRTEGIFPTHSCRENVTAPWLARLGFAGFFSVARERRCADDLARRMGTRFRRIEQPVATLSGGNQQKLLLGRWLGPDPSVLLFDEPTRGVDIGAKEEIHDEIRRLAGLGKAVLLISSDLPEVLALSHRVCVLREGTVGGEFAGVAATETAVVEAAFPREKSAERQGGRAQRSASAGARFAVAARELGAFGALAVLAGVITLLCGREFASTANLLDILASASLVSIAAAGTAQVLIAGGIDISVGSMLGLVGALACTTALHGLPPLLVIAIGACLGAFLGLLNATVSYGGGIHPIVVTLAGIYVYRGLMLRFTGGYEVMNLPDAFRAIADGTWVGIPKVVWCAAGVHAANAWFLNRTLLGRRLYAVGGSEKAAALAGLRPQAVRSVAFAIGGALVGLTSVLWGAYYGKIQSNTGTGFELQVVAAAVIGGCAVTGGRGGALGVVAGSVLIAVVYNALVLLRISATWQGVFVGALILAAAALDGWFHRKTEGAER
jgi:ABC-type sugar transport system ATPase subunit/ribose/xylose/arabinose/galactoside ABC-type transport system permease subunit